VPRPIFTSLPYTQVPPVDTTPSQSCPCPGVERRCERAVAPPCPTTLCVEKFTLPYLTIH